MWQNDSLIARLLSVGLIFCMRFQDSQGLPYEVVKMMWNSQKVPVTDITPGNLSRECWEASFNATSDNITHAIDAFGKMPAGVLVGNLAWLGHYEECTGLFEFQYCLLEFNISMGTGNVEKYEVESMQYGLCVPNACTTEDVTNGFKLFLDHIPSFDFKDRLHIQHEPWCTAYRQLPTPGFFISVVFFGFLFLVVVSSSIYFSCQEAQGLYTREASVNTQTHTDPQTDITGSDTAQLIAASSTSAAIESGRPGTSRQISVRGDSKLDRIIHSFALPRNMPALLSGKTPSDTIRCLNGMRVISLLWVILAHVFSFIGTFSEPYNPETGKSWFRRFLFPIISNPHSSGDSFFFFSGLLVTFLTLNKMKVEDGRINWVWFYLHRYWRLLPPLAFTMIFYTCITPYFGEGPFAQMLGVRQNCPKYWWTNLLFINNFYPVNIANQCMPWVWYLANHMQFFFISPIILVPLYYIPKVGFCLLTSLFVGSVSVTGILVGLYDFQAVPGLNTNTSYWYWDVIYTKPYCRIQPYLIGIVTGYVFYRYPKNSVKMNAFLGFLGWTLFGTIGGFVINTIPSGYSGSEWNLPFNILYHVFSKTIWTLYVAWVAFVCHYGHGGWVNALLSHNIWVPLSRLTYSAFLLHPIIIMLYLANLGTPPYLSLQLMSFTFAGICLITYVCAIILSLMVEIPLAHLEKLILPRR